METSKMTPLKQNNRWKLDNDEKNNTFGVNSSRFRNSRGRGGGFNRGRNDRYQRENTFSKIKKDQYKYNEDSFPTLGSNTKQPVTLPQLNWAAAAQRGALAPSPKPKVKKITKNKLETIKKDIKYESDDEESILTDNGVEYQNDVFPAKGGYLD